MFTATQKTKAEIEGEAVDTEMTQEEYSKKYMSGSKDTFWHCDACKVLFQDSDVIIERTFKSEHEPRCPLIFKASIKHWWRGVSISERKCLNRLMCSNLDYFQKNYHLEPRPETNV